MEKRDIDTIRKIAVNICNKYRLRRDTVEDLAQDAVLKILEKKDKFDPERSSWSTWLYSVAINEMINKALAYDIPVTIPKTSWQDGITESKENTHGRQALRIIGTYGPSSLSVDVESIDTTKNDIHASNSFSPVEETELTLFIETLTENRDIAAEIIELAKEGNPEFSLIFEQWDRIKERAPHIIKQNLWKQMESNRQ